MKSILGFWLFLFSGMINAEIINIAFKYDSGSNAEIPTVVWKNPDSIATLIFIPGGKGSFGLNQKPDPKPTWVLSELHKQASVPMNLVFLDSIHPLQGDSGTPYARWAPRREPRHIEQIKQTIHFYRATLNKPVFLLGHSNGSLSISEFLKQSADNQKLVSGLIFSGSRNETDPGEKITVPVLILHHMTDPNRWTTPSAAEQLFSRIKQNNASLTEQAWVKGGADVWGGDPVHSGRHMYHDANLEAAHHILDFVTKVLAKQ